MNLYQILTPLWRNDHVRNYEAAREHFEGVLLKLAGGYTALPQAKGAWISPTTKKPVKDVHYPYQVICDAKTWRLILAEAFRLYEDQEAISWANIGQGYNATRPAPDPKARLYDTP